jgi:hypothetical protein
MKAIAIASLALAALTVSAAIRHHSEKAVIGEVTPEWSSVDSNGKTQDIAKYRGKFVVLEWTNPECPFVKKHYGSGNMQATQKKATAMGAVWLSIDSSAEGREGYMSPVEANSIRKGWKVNSTATILDASGDLGRMYSARTTPQIVIINPKGVVIYNGAIDDRPTADPSDIQGAKNFALTNLSLAMAGKPVEESTTRPYGCSVKYGN